MGVIMGGNDNSYLMKVRARRWHLHGRAGVAVLFP